MDKSSYKLHFFQTEILSKLAVANSLKFNELLIEGLESEHTNYHLKQLIELQFVRKTEKGYTLTDAGKDYVNSMDDDTKHIEKQPKTSVLLNIVRTNENGEIEFLLARRKKQPYLDKVGRLTGKVRMGETVFEAAARELQEETGLTAQSFELISIYHKIRTKKDEKSNTDTTVQDVIFYVFCVKDTVGTLIAKSPYQENFWSTEHNARNSPEIDLFEDTTFNIFDNNKPLSFIEEKLEAIGY